MIETSLLSRAAALGDKQDFLAALRRVADAPLPPFESAVPADAVPLEDLIDERVGK